MKKLTVTLTTIISLIFSLSVIAQGEHPSGKTVSNTIVDVAVSNKDFSTLVTALKAADLVGALQGNGPFTVFAPTNDAFAKIDSKALSSLLEEENKNSLANILTYHVIASKLTATDVVAALGKGSGSVVLTALNTTTSDTTIAKLGFTTFINKGTLFQPTFEKLGQHHIDNPLSTINLKVDIFLDDASSPIGFELADVTGTGLPDLIVGQSNGQVMFFGNIGSVKKSVFKEFTGTKNPLLGFFQDRPVAPVVTSLSTKTNVDWMEADESYHNPPSTEFSVPGD